MGKSVHIKFCNIQRFCFLNSIYKQSIFNEGLWIDCFHLISLSNIHTMAYICQSTVRNAEQQFGCGFYVVKNVCCCCCCCCCFDLFCFFSSFASVYSCLFTYILLISHGISTTLFSWPYCQCLPLVSLYFFPCTSVHRLHRRSFGHFCGTCSLNNAKCVV